jgi:hypothetical protein
VDSIRYDSGMSKLGTMAAVAVAIAGLALFAVGIYFVKFSAICVPGESHLVCLRSWLSAVGPIIAGVALMVALAQFSLSRDTAQRQLRAYIGIHSMSSAVYPFENGGFTYIAQAELRNFGQTPAYELTGQSNSTIDLPDATPFDETQGPAKAAGLGVAFRDAGIHVKQWKHVSAEEFAALRDQKKRVFLWGVVKYKDAFGSLRKFTFRIASAEAAVGTNNIFSMAPYPPGIEAD